MRGVEDIDDVDDHEVGTNEAVEELLENVSMPLSCSGSSSSCCSSGLSVATGALDISITIGGFVAGLLPKTASIASK